MPLILIKNNINDNNNNKKIIFNIEDICPD